MRGCPKIEIVSQIVGVPRSQIVGVPRSCPDRARSWVSPDCPRLPGCPQIADRGCPQIAPDRHIARSCPAAHHLCRPFRAEDLLGRQTQGVALGYLIEPFQGCLNSRMPRVDAWVSQDGGSSCVTCVGVPRSHQDRTCAAPSGLEIYWGDQPRALPWATLLSPFRAVLTRACRAWMHGCPKIVRPKIVCCNKSSRPVTPAAHHLCRPFRAGELLGRQTQGVAPGYLIQPFQGCVNSRLLRCRLRW
jgi:hypothetical protein